MKTIRFAAFLILFSIAGSVSASNAFYGPHPGHYHHHGWGYAYGPRVILAPPVLLPPLLPPLGPYYYRHHGGYYGHGGGYGHRGGGYYGHRR